MKNLFSLKIKSFVLGRGRITSSQRNAIENHGDKWIIKLQKPANVESFFKKRANVTLEIGFGMGDTLINSAVENPTDNFIGIEVYKSGIGRVLNKIEELGIKNIRLIEGDAVEINKNIFVDNSFKNIHLFFPDPWPKKKHHKRRIIQKSFVDSIAKNLMISGCFHCATDNVNYAEQMLTALTDCKHLTNLADGFSKRPADRVVSKFEKRALDSNRKIFNLSFIKEM